jgi:hypothetical protein
MFLNYFRMIVSSFDNVHRRLEGSLQCRNTKMRNYIQPGCCNQVSNVRVCFERKLWWLNRKVFSWEKIIHVVSILFNLVTSDPSILSTNELWDVCLPLISFDTNLSWSLYTYFLAFEDPAPNFVACLCLSPTLRSSLERFPTFLLLVQKTQNCITKISS